MHITQRLIDILFIILCFLQVVRSQDTDRKEITLYKDQYLLLTLSHPDSADISKPEWLKLIFTNTSDKHIQIKDAYYSLDSEMESHNGTSYINHGSYGQGNHYDLFPFFDGLKNPSDHRNRLSLNARSSIEVSRYLTNYASVLMDSRNSGNLEVCVLFNFRMSYAVDDSVYEIRSDNNPFCTFWTNSDHVSDAHLERRLRNAILSPGYRAADTYLTQTLMSIPGLSDQISDSVFIQSIFMRGHMGEAESCLFLKELSKRGEIPNSQLTRLYHERLAEDPMRLSRELHYYWDNSLLEPLLTSEVYVPKIAAVLELHAEDWSRHKAYKERVYHYLLEKLNFSLTTLPDSNKLTEWVANIKMIAISRHAGFIDYLKPFLNNETTYTINDWSKYQSFGFRSKDMQPDKIQARICDSAFIALLRAYGHIKFSVRGGHAAKFDYYDVTMRNEILDQEQIARIEKSRISGDIEMRLYEREITLTEEMKGVLGRK